jgi:hypothetical protein
MRRMLLNRSLFSSLRTIRPIFKFDKVMFFGRDGESICSSYDLSSHDLEGRSVLDIPGGPSTFCQHAREVGALRAKACDPMYQLSLTDQEALALQDLSYVESAMLGLKGVNSEDINDLISHQRDEVLPHFLLDQRTNCGDYVAAALPHNLPFEDESFDLVVSSHLLFSYAPMHQGGVLDVLGDEEHIMGKYGAPVLDLEWHLKAIKELMRVSRSEVRIFDVCSIDEDLLDGEPKLHPFVGPIVATLPPQWAATVYRPTSPYRSSGFSADDQLSGLKLYRTY